MHKNVVWIVILFVASALLYQNCGAPIHSSITAQSVQFSGSCESSLMNAFGSTYYPTFKAQCASCHSSGPGLGYFANPDFQTAFTSFNSLGRARVERNFLNPGHQAGITGPQHQALVDRSLSAWQAAEQRFTDCAREAGIDTVPGQEILTVSKANATILQRANMGNNAWVRLEWDLENEMALGADRGKYLMVFSVEVRVAIANGAQRGYEFRNVVVRLKPGATTPYRISKIYFGLNQNVLYDVTTYSQMSALVLSMTDINLAPNASLALAVHSPVAATDAFSLAFGTITADSMTPIGGGTGGGTTGGGTTGGMMPTPLPATVTHTQLTSTNVDLGVFRRACFNCHSGANIRAGLDLSNYTGSRNLATEIVGRMNNTGNPMPPSGILSERDRDLVRIWQTGGTPQ